MTASLQTTTLIEIELLKLLIAILLGGVIGWQREHTGHEAGIRTFSSICMGSCLFGIISQSMGPMGDPGRIAAQVVSGIGFIGIGVIIREGGSIKGLTTAATLWSMSAIGLAISFNLYIIALLATTLIFMSLFLSRTKFWHHIARRPGDHNYHNTVNDDALTHSNGIADKIMPKSPFIPTSIPEASTVHSCCCHHGCSVVKATSKKNQVKMKLK